MQPYAFIPVGEEILRLKEVWVSLRIDNHCFTFGLKNLMNVKGDKDDHQYDQGDDEDDHSNATSSQDNGVGGSFGHYNLPWWQCLLDWCFSFRMEIKIAIEPILLSSFFKPLEH